MPLDEQLERECARAVEAEAMMRKRLGELENLHPQLSRLTVPIRHEMIVMLAFVNAIRTTVGAKRMLGEVSQEVPQASVHDTPLFAVTESKGLAQSHELPAAAQLWKEIWTGDRIASVPMLEKQMKQSLHRAGDHTQDSEEEAA